MPPTPPPPRINPPPPFAMENPARHLVGRLLPSHPPSRQNIETIVSKINAQLTPQTFSCCNFPVQNYRINPHTNCCCNLLTLSCAVSTRWVAKITELIPAGTFCCNFAVMKLQNRFLGIAFAALLFLDDPNLLKIRSLDSSCPFFLSDSSAWGQWTQMPKCYDRRATIAFRTTPNAAVAKEEEQRENSKCCNRLGKTTWTPHLRRLGFSRLRQDDAR